MRFRSAALTDIGKIREENEDRYLRDDELGLFAVADGIGGLPGGAQAAEEAIMQLHAQAQRLAGESHWDFTSLIAMVNQQVIRRGETIDSAYGIGTTLTVARLRDSGVHVAHVGDSGCYLWRAGVFEKLTHDHTLENELKARHGHAAIAFLNARSRNALTRCVGQPTAPEVDVILRPLHAGDRLLLCSDGVTRFMREEEIGRTVGTAPEPATGLAQMIDLVSDRGGYDNATGVLIFVDAV